MAVCKPRREASKEKLPLRTPALGFVAPRATRKEISVATEPTVFRHCSPSR